MAKISFEILNNFSPKLDSKNGKINKIYIQKRKKLTIIYAGNIGRFQSLSSVIEVMSRLRKYKNIELLLMGEGRKK